MASNVCFRGAAGGPALGRPPSPAQSSPAAEAPHSPGERALRAWLPRDSGLGAWLRDRRLHLPGLLFPPPSQQVTAGPGTPWLAFRRQSAIREMRWLSTSGAKATHLEKIVLGSRAPSCSAVAGTSGNLALGTQAAFTPRRFSFHLQKKFFVCFLLMNCRLGIFFKNQNKNTEKSNFLSLSHNTNF